MQPSDFSRSIPERLGDCEAVLFDLDGTLIDSREDLTLCVIESFRLCGFPVPLRERIDPLMGWPLEEIPEALGLSMDAAGMEALIRAFRGFYPDHWLDNTRPYPGVREGLSSLASSLPLAVVTTKQQMQALRICDALGLSPHFRHIQGWREGLRHKPAPDMLLEALRALGVRPEKAVMVGDTFRDVLAGKEAGCFTVAVTYGTGDPAELRRLRPDAEAASFAQVAERLLRLATKAGKA